MNKIVNNITDNISTNIKKIINISNNETDSNKITTKEVNNFEKCIICDSEMKNKYEKCSHYYCFTCTKEWYTQTIINSKKNNFINKSKIYKCGICNDKISLNDKKKFL